jgi:hypothetical protein
LADDVGVRGEWLFASTRCGAMRLRNVGAWGSMAIRLIFDT